VKDKPIDHFIQKRDQLVKNLLFMAKVLKTANEKSTVTFYMVSYRITQADKSHMDLDQSTNIHSTDRTIDRHEAYSALQLHTLQYILFLLKK
jgi:hypothetical protein